MWLRCCWWKVCVAEMLLVGGVCGAEMLLVEGVCG